MDPTQPKTPSKISPSGLIARLRARYGANAASPDGAHTRQAAAIGGLAVLVLLGG